MSEANFAKRLLGETARNSTENEPDEDGARSKQRQVGAASFEVEFKDGRSGEGFSWSDYRRHSWGQNGEKEWVKVLFGNTLVTMTGYQMDEARNDVGANQLKHAREMSPHEVLLLLNDEGYKKPIFESITVEPAFEEIEEEIKSRGEDDGKPGKPGKTR